MSKYGKKHIEALKEIEQGKFYEPKEALELCKKVASAKFDETVEMHIRMGLDPRQANQQVRGVALLPAGLGKSVKVLVFAQGDAEKAALAAGADYAGSDELISKISEGWLDFDIAIATPDMMGRVGKLGKQLGRKGLMPNPKSGTVVAANDLQRAIEDARKGRVEYKLDRQAIIHVIVGKVSFDTEKLFVNMSAVMEAIVHAKPAGAKGQYIKSVYVKSTMGPGIPVDTRLASDLTVA
jgi:large subunit ribosomal protein L1